MYAKAFALTFKGDNNLPRVPLKVVDHYKYLGVEMVTGATKFKMYKKRVAALGKNSILLSTSNGRGSRVHVSSSRRASLEVFSAFTLGVRSCPDG